MYGRYELDVERRDGRWIVYRRGEGTRREDPSVFIPAGVPEDAIASFLDDLLHEAGHPDGTVRRIE